MNRLADLALAVPALAAAAPAIGALALAVKLDSPGPAFYVQRRVGKDRRPFGLMKLRSMVSDADRKGAHVTAAGDSRVTRVGRLLRATKLDELPQLWNVVTGDMSMVGPRPEAERYVTDAHAAWELVLSVRPGITDLASIVFRDEESLLGGAVDRERAYLEAVLPEKLALAQEGIERASLSHDLAVLAKTALAVLQGGNADHPAVVRARAAVRALSERAAEPARLPPRGAKLPVVRDEPVESVRLTPAPPAKDRAPKSTAARAPAKSHATPAPKRAPAKTAPRRAPAKTAPRRAPAKTASKRAPAKSAAKTPAAPKPRRPKKER